MTHLGRPPPKRITGAGAADVPNPAYLDWLEAVRFELWVLLGCVVVTLTLCAGPILYILFSEEKNDV